MDIQAPPSPKKPESRTSTLLKIIGGCCILITIIVLGIVGYFGNIFLQDFIKIVRDPHASHIATDDIFAVPPLIGPHTPFDLVLTIWAKKPQDVKREQELIETYQASAEYDWATVAEIARINGMPVNDQVYPNDEKLVYSGYVARGMTLGEKHREVDVDFEIPLKRFHDSRLYSLDVRATLSLIPPLEVMNTLVNYTDWRPDEAAPWPRLSEGMIAAISKELDDPPDIALQAIKYMGISWGLIEFKKIPHPCNDSLSILQPYIVTRSNAFLVNETRAYNSIILKTKHAELKRQACRLNILGKPISRWACSRGYKSSGEWEHLLTMEDGARYAPFISVLADSAGPKHHVKLPVTRECCGVDDCQASDPTTFSSTLRFAFSVLYPGRLTILESFLNKGAELAHNATDLETALAHDGWEHVAALLGVHMPHKRPWTLTILWALMMGIYLISFVLTVTYWYTRRTTTGINISSAYVMCLSAVFDVVLGIHSSLVDTEGLLNTTFDILSLLPGLIPTFFLAKAITPFVIQRVPSWKFTRSKLTHRERSSVRNERSWKNYIPLAIGVYALFYLRTYLPYLRKPSHPAPPLSTMKSITWPIANSLGLTASIMQVDHNRIAKTFAGQYAINAMFDLVADAVNLLGAFALGRAEHWDGIDVVDVVQIGIAVIWAVQALQYPRVEQEVEGEEDI